MNDKENIFYKDKDIEAGLIKIDTIRKLIEKENKEQNILPKVYEDIYPMTLSEQGMIYSSMLRPDDPIYYDQYKFFIEIDELENFRNSLSKLIKRQGNLRSQYYMKTFSQPVKVVLHQIEIPLIYNDISGYSQDIQKEIIDNSIDDDLALKFSFNGELLWRLYVFRLTKSKYLILWSAHRSISDGLSVSIFVKELTDLLSQKRDYHVNDLKYNYKDYCALLLSKEKSEIISRYWKGALAGYTRNKLPFNSKRKKNLDENRMKKVSEHLDHELFSSLNHVALNHQLSFKSICLAAHVFLLHVICAEQDVVTGVVTHNRPEIEDGENILGCFLNTIPIRVLLNDFNDILSLLKFINTYLLEIKPKEIHLSEIALLINEKSSLNNPIFDTIFNFTDFHSLLNLDENSSVKAITSELEAATQDANQMTNTLFDLEVDKTADLLTVQIKYSISYFDDHIVQYALELYIRILKLFVKDVNLPLSSLNLLSNYEYKEVVNDFNSTLTFYNSQKTIHQLFEEQVVKTPNAIALRHNNDNLTYLELNEKSNQVARYLLANGVQSGENVGLLVSRSFEMIIGMYSILKAGCAYVPIDPEYPVERQEYIIKNSNINNLLCDSDYIIAKKNLDKIFFNMEVAELSDLDRENLNIKIDSKQLAYTIYTSGSTGLPKGVMIEHHSVINLIEWVNNEFQVTEDDRLLFITSICFDLSVYDVFGMLSRGGTVIIAATEEIKDFEKLKIILKAEKITFWNSVPSTMSHLIADLEHEHSDYKQPNLRIVFLSGDWIPVQLPDSIRKYFPFARIISLGGATECTVWSNSYPIENIDPSWNSIPYGKPAYNNFFYILDNHQRPVPKGVVGELYIGGVGVARGYANDITKTENSFRKDDFNSQLGGRMYKTGDMARWLSDGNVEFLGRMDDQVKIRGYRVELGEIENALQGHAGVESAVVVARPNAAGEKELVAYVVSGKALNITGLRSHLSRSLPKYMVPAHYVQLEELPLNSNGKVDRKKLADPSGLSLGMGREYVAARNGTEAELVRIWEEVLGKKGIGVKDNFFDLGGHSLKLVQLSSCIHRAFEVKVALRDLFIHTVPEDQAQLVRQALKTSFINIEPQASGFIARQYFPLNGNGKIDREFLSERKSRIAGNKFNYEAPRDETEQVLVSIWQRLLHADGIGIKDNFFELGGHSLIAIRVVSSIMRELNIELTIDDLFSHPTIAELADYLKTNNRNKFKYLVPINTSGNKMPLYIICGSGGTVYKFREFVSLLDTDQPVYVLQQFADNYDTDDFPDTIEGVASRYIDEILLHNPAGPYALSGHCLGGNIALEMARQLEAMGKKVSMLAMFDVSAEEQKEVTHPSITNFYNIPAFTKKALNVILETMQFQLFLISGHPKQALQYKISKLKSFFDRHKPGPEEMEAYVFNELTLKLDKALNSYKMKSYEGEILVFIPTQTYFFVDEVNKIYYKELPADPEAGEAWKKYAGSVKIYNVKGEHSTIFEALNAKEFSSILQKHLNESLVKG
ncbi:MAG TPA: amino acid adenylation domain-containing protein [Mucilaginibacter sp.]|jgi:amino acid adenylation domain-containing protein